MHAGNNLCSRRLAVQHMPIWRVLLPGRFRLPELQFGMTSTGLLFLFLVRRTRQLSFDRSTLMPVHFRDFKQPAVLPSKPLPWLFSPIQPAVLPAVLAVAYRAVIGTDGRTIGIAFLTSKLSP